MGENITRKAAALPALQGCGVQSSRAGCATRGRVCPRGCVASTELVLGAAAGSWAAWSRDRVCTRVRGSSPWSSPLDPEELEPRVGQEESIKEETAE